jgi:transposase
MRAVTGRRRRYPSDTTATEWRLIEPLLPTPACHTSRGGRPEKHDRRAIVDAIRYIVDNGAKWRALPSDYPPWRPVYGPFVVSSGKTTIHAVRAGQGRGPGLRLTETGPAGARPLGVRGWTSRDPFHHPITPGEGRGRNHRP